MSDIDEATKTPRLSHPVLDENVSTTRHWWLLLITGVAWIVIAIVILRFDYGTVAAIAALFGIFSFVAAANEVMVAAVSSKGWRIPVSWVAAGALLHGIGQIASAFVVRRVGRDVAAIER